MQKRHILRLAAALVAIAARELLVPGMAHSAPAQMSVCVTKVEFALVSTSSGQRYRAVTTFSGHPTFTFLSFTPGGPMVQAVGQMGYDSFTKWRDFYDTIRAAAQSKVKLALSYDDTTRSISSIAAQFDQPC
jgi:hypothetical protein